MYVLYEMLLSVNTSNNSSHKVSVIQIDQINGNEVNLPQVGFILVRADLEGSLHIHYHMSGVNSHEIVNLRSWKGTSL